MQRLLRQATLLLVLAAPVNAGEQIPKPLLTGLKNPQAVAVGADGKIYLTVAGDGAVLAVGGSKAVPFATGLNEPRGLAAYQQWLFVADKQGVWRIDRKGKAQVFAAAAVFPSPPRSLHDLTADPESGTLYVSDAG